MGGRGKSSPGFQTETQAQNYLQNNNWTNGSVSQIEDYSLSQYQGGNLSFLINKVARGQTSIATLNKKQSTFFNMGYGTEIKTYIDTIDGVINRSKTKKELLAHRGIKGEYAKQIISKIKNGFLSTGDSIMNAGFTSVSLDSKHIDMFMHNSDDSVKINVTIPKGYNAVNPYPLTKKGLWESEIIMKRNAELEITKIHQDSSGLWNIDVTAR
jgi:hypothetical protein